jgi:predicted aspartyl protease
VRRVGTFYAHCAVQNATDRSRQSQVKKILVDTGSEHTWIPSSVLDRIGVAREKKDITFVMANGAEMSRSIGFAIIHIDDVFTIDEVVFADKGDLLLLGARTLEGLNLTVDARRKKLVAAGPIPAALCLTVKVDGDRELRMWN